MFPDTVKKYGQELDADQLTLIDIPNFTGYSGDTLMDDKFAGMSFDCIVANPPFSIKWHPELLKDDERFKSAPALPPPSKADWAFMLHILNHLSNDGVAVVLEFPGILYRGQREYKVRRWFIENNYIDRVVNVPGNTFEDTTISTCIIVMKKNRKTTDVIFEDGERNVCVPQQNIAEQDFTLSTNMYLPDDTPKEEIDIDSVNYTVVKYQLQKLDETFRTLTELQRTFDDNFYIDELKKGVKEILIKYKE